MINLATTRREFVTADELAEILVVKVRTVYQWIDKGALTALKFEGIVRIPIAAAREITRIHREEQSRQTRASSASIPTNGLQTH